MSETKIMTTCGGQIGQTGYCNKCGHVAMTSSCYCGRLIEVVNEPSQDELWYEVIRPYYDGNTAAMQDVKEFKKRYRITRITS